MLRGTHPCKVGNNSGLKSPLKSVGRTTSHKEQGEDGKRDPINELCFRRQSLLPSDRMWKRPGLYGTARVGSHPGRHLRFCELRARPRLCTVPPPFPAFSKRIISAHPEGGLEKIPHILFLLLPQEKPMPAFRTKQFTVPICVCLPLSLDSKSDE